MTKRTWEQEEAYTQKRGEELKREMDEAIEAKDRKRFHKAYEASMRYLKKTERSAYYRKFLGRVTIEKEGE